MCSVPQCDITPPSQLVAKNWFTPKPKVYIFVWNPPIHVTMSINVVMTGQTQLLKQEIPGNDFCPY